MSKDYVSEKERIDSRLYRVSNIQIISIPEKIFVSTICIDLHCSKEKLMDRVEHFLNIGLIDIDKKGYYGFTARKIEQSRLEAEKLEKESPNTTKETKELLKSFKPIKDKEE